MNIQLIQGEFDAQDTVELVSQLIQVKIKFHENKVSNTSNEEDIKYRESKIKYLQAKLVELRATLVSKNTRIDVDALIKMN